MPGVRLNRRGLRAIVGLCAIAYVLYSSQLLDFSGRRFDTWLWTACPDPSSCTASRALLARDVQVVVKTGASEPPSRLRYQLETVLSRVSDDNVLIFSDLEDDVGRYHVHDAYAGISKQERAAYPEFVLYDTQQELHRLGKDVREVQHGWAQGGWALAKYMNLAMTREIWRVQRKPGNEGLASRKWFVFVDTDTFIEWDNLLELLSHLHAQDRMYIGSPVWLPGLQFAHGGSAYALSAGAMQALNSDDSDHPMMPFHSQYGFNTTALCCGDEALARALKARGVRLKGYWPMFNGEAPATLTFGRETWCEPVISLHHLSGKDMKQFWQWIEDWKISTKNARPLLFQDLFGYIEPSIASVREDWDNMHESMRIAPKDKASHTSVGHCRAGCEADSSCLQHAYDGRTCWVSHHIRLGRERKPEERGSRKFRSGWMMERVQDWVAEHQCTSAHWVRPNP